MASAGGAATSEDGGGEEWRARAAQILPTEHFTLQSARSATIADSSGRASLFIGSVSAALVALGLVGGGTGLGVAFKAFALVLFPPLFFLGLATFNRVAQSGVEDMLYARGINRIRRFYLDFVPEAAPYFILSANDDAVGVMRNMGIAPSRWQMFLTTAGAIGVVNSVIAGAFAALAVDLLGVPLGVAVVGGALVFLVSAVAHYRVESRGWAAGGGHDEVLFPSPPGPANMDRGRS